MSNSNGYIKQFSGMKGGDGNGIQEFLESNSLIGKIAFFLLVLFMFIVLLRIGIGFFGWIYSSVNDNPKLINGMVDAKQLIVIPQDPSVSGHQTINRSVNASQGIEFTWSVWIFVDDMTYNSGKYKTVFYKGNDGLQSNGLNFPNNAPGLYIAPNTNDLVVIMNTFNVINEEILISDIPLNKWINVIIRVENVNLDVYINGLITKSHILHGVPKQNYGDIYVAMNGGFSGNISNLWYWDYALGIAAIQWIASHGPNTTIAGDSALNDKDPYYLSMRWYFYGDGDAYNPTAKSASLGR
jgi:hypothetical protein